MSYILDALKRAERERKQGQVSVLDELPATPAGIAAPRRRLPLGLLAAALAVLVIAVLSYLLLRRHHAGPVLAAPAPAAQAGPRLIPPPPPPVQAPPPAPAAAEPAAPPAATIEDGGKIATLDDVAPAPAPAAAPPAEAAKPQLRPPAQANADTSGIETHPMDARQGPPPPAAQGQADEAAAPPPPVQAQAEPPAPAADAGRQLKEMPESYRAGFPSFSVDVHVYDDNPKKRFILVGGKRYREGDTMAEGPHIVAIVPEGLVLDWQGQQVLYAITR